MRDEIHTPVQVARYFIQKSIDEGNPLTNMKVLKLVYIAHGWYLGITGKPLINEAVEAWKYGPVIRSLYERFKVFGARPITTIPNEKVDFTNQTEDLDFKVFLDKIWDVYKGFTARQLSTLTHEMGSPWDLTINKNGGQGIIPNDLIEKYYRSRMPEVA